MKVTTKTKSFIKQFVALAQGETAEAIAQKVYRQADSALNTHIAVLTGDLVSKEDALINAQEHLEKARINFGKEITDRDYYIKNLIEAKNRVTSAEEALETHKAKLDFLKEESANLEKEV